MWRDCVVGSLCYLPSFKLPLDVAVPLCPSCVLNQAPPHLSRWQDNDVLFVSPRHTNLIWRWRKCVVRPLRHRSVVFSAIPEASSQGRWDTLSFLCFPPRVGLSLVVADGVVGPLCFLPSFIFLCWWCLIDLIDPRRHNATHLHFFSGEGTMLLRCS